MVNTWVSGLLSVLPILACRAQHTADTGARPFFLTLHLAGGTGLVALGGGYRVARQRLEPELLIGYVPRKLSGGQPLAIFTLKATYLPWTTQLGHGTWQATPFTLGALVNYTTGQQFFLTNNTTGKYRSGYYWWSSAVRLGLLTGTRLHYSPRRYGPPTTAYAELSTNDLHLVSRFTNRSLRVVDILTLGGGIKQGL